MVALTPLVGGPQARGKTTTDMIHRLAVDASLYQEVLPHTQAWRLAILQRDVPAIESYAFPEHKAVLSRVLKQKGSWQSRYLFGSWKYSLRSLMMKRDRVLLFEETDRPITWPPSVTACYVTADESLKSWPARDLALKEMTVKAHIPCQVFSKSEGRWTATLDSLYER